MNRILTFIVIFLLPLQLSWGTAAIFCQHEVDNQWHWGHHAEEAECQKIDSNNNAKKDNFTKSEKKHAVHIACHADHLNIKQQGTVPLDLLGLLIPKSYESGPLIQFTANFYQSPFLEKPKPPRWPA